MITLFILSIIISFGFIALAIFVLYQASPRRKPTAYFNDSQNSELQKLINLAKSTASRPQANITKPISPDESKKQYLQKQLRSLVNYDINLAQQLLKLERKKIRDIQIIGI
jgi:hypothetical protein